MDLSQLVELLGKLGISVAGGIGAYVAIKTDIAEMRARLTLVEKNADYQRDRLEKHLDRSRQNTET